MSHARRAPSRPWSTSRSRRRQSSHTQRRNLRVEPLEIRAVMDGDAIANPFHNSWFPTDVNFDYSVTPLDALLIVNELNAGGARELVLNGADGANGEQGVSSLVDVSGDGMLTPLDALLVLNHLNGSGQGPAVISYQMQIVGADGNPLPEIAGQPGHFQVQKGQAFGVRLSVRDNRPESTLSVDINGNTYYPYDQFPFGVSTTYADLHFNPSLVDLGAPNIQTIRLVGYGQAADKNTNGGTMVINVPTIGDTAAINLQRPGVVNIPGVGNITISAESARQGNRGNIQTALDQLLGVGNARVQNNGANDDYRIVFTGQLTNTNFDITAPVTNSFSGTSTVNRVFDPTNLELTDRNDMIAALNYNLFQNYNVFPNFKRLYGTLPESGGRVFEVLQEVSPTEWVISTLGGTSLSSSAGGDIDVNLTPGPNFDDETDYEREKADLPDGYFTIATPYFIASEVGTSQFNVSAPGNDASINSSAQSLLVVSELPTDPTTGQPVSGQPFTVVSWANIEIPTPLFVVVSADVTAVNDPVTINEDAGDSVIDVLANDTNNVGPDENLVVTGVGTAGNQGPFATSKGSVSIVNGEVVYTPNENEFGTDSFTYFINNGDPNATDSATVLITLTEINDDPVAVDDGPLTTPEDVMLSITLASLRANDTSGPDPLGTPPAGDALAISTTPGAAVNGTVVYNAGTQSFEFTPAANYNGSASFSYTLTDGRGGTATATVSINVTARNDRPTFNTPLANPSILEDAGAQTIPTFVTGFSPGPADEASQTLLGYTVTVLNTTGALTFSAAPAIDTNGQLTFTAAAHAWGEATVQVVAQDSGGTTNGGLDTSLPVTFTITVANVNDPPQFTLPATHTSREDLDQPVTQTGFVTGISPGVNEQTSGQTVSFSLTNDNLGLFTVQPAISANGTLTYTAAPNAFGAAIVTVTATDTGDTANGGSNTTVQQFTINVTPTNDPPTANPDTASVPDGAIDFEVDVLSNDSKGVDAADPNEELIIESFQVVGSLPEEVSISISSDGKLLLVSTDLGYFNKPDLIVNYTIRDRASASDPDKLTANSTVTLSFIPNRLPLAVDDVVNGVVSEDADDVELNPLVNDRSVAFNVGDLRITGISLDNLEGDAAGWVTDTITGANGLEISISPDGTRVLFSPADDVFGAFTFYYRMDDVVNQASEDYDGPDAGRIIVNIVPVNDAPSFVLNQTSDTVLEDSGARSVPGFATGSPGPFETQLVNGVPYDSVSFDVVAADTTLFSVQPAISSNGTLTYTPAPNANTTSPVIITVNARDSFGLTSATQTFEINITPVNDVPTFTKGADVTRNEDSGPATITGWATNISAGPADEAGQVLTFSATNTNNALFSAQPTVDASGNLTFTPATDAFGTATVTVRLSDDGGTANGGIDFSEQTFVITINAVNDVPSFTKGADQSVVEDAGAQTVTEWATDLSKGPDNESGQSLSFLVSNDKNELFSVQPTIDSNGTLSYTPAANAFGTATVTVRIQDDGGTANGGVDTSAEQTFTITVRPVNDVPSFTKGADVTVLEDAGAQTRTGWATNLSKGPANESSQTLNFIVSTNNDALFSVLPAIDASGNLTFTAASNANGSAVVTVTLRDDGGTVDGGVDTSAPQTFNINVTAVNDVPSFTKGPDVVVAEDAGLQTRTDWATAISAGPADEVATQTVTFEIVNIALSGVHNPTQSGVLFSTAPAVSSNGTLTFTPAANAFGTATITIRARDNGGTANGGVDASATQTFTVTVNSVNDAPPAVNDGPIRVFKTAGPALFNVLSNDAPNVDPGETLTLANVTITSPTSFPPETTPTATIVNNQIQFAPNGYVGTVQVTYTVDDGSGATNSTATAVATFDVVDFVPGSISGIIWADVDDGGDVDPAVTPYGPERRLAEIEVYLVGETMFGESVSTMTRTNHLGAYSFANLVPGSYTVSLDNPATGSMVENVELFIDGKDNINGSNSVTTANGSVQRMSNNMFSVTFDEGGLDVANLNFGMLGLQAKYVNIRDHLANSTTNGAVFGANLGMPSDSQMYWYSMYDGWNGMHSLKITLSSDLTSATIQARDAANTLHSTTLSFTNDWMKIRVMGRDGNNVVVRLVGNVSDFFPTADLIGDEVAASEPGMYAEGEGAEYAAAADEVFNGEAWA